MTSGASVMETVAPLEVRARGLCFPAKCTLALWLSGLTRCPSQEVGLKVTDVVVLIDRQQGGEAHLASKACACVGCTRLLLTRPATRV